ncbi:hypothetical protein A7979_07690 [Rothia nasimurium]|uniref:Uncharacterized protein n=1 Tax=Rothia nasimurium TaxID=85336 RepID=A0A1Y1RNK2_9MICC|nr:hypothetical protein A7979_07690 [Rothia nasimurium]
MIPIMSSTGINNQDGTPVKLSNLIDQSMRLINSTRPQPRELSSQGLRFPDTREWSVPCDVLDEGIDTFESLSIFRLPVNILLPGFV